MTSHFRIHFVWFVPLAVVGMLATIARGEEPADQPRARVDSPPRAEGNPRFPGGPFPPGRNPSDQKPSQPRFSPPPPTRGDGLPRPEGPRPPRGEGSFDDPQRGPPLPGRPGLPPAPRGGFGPPSGNPFDPYDARSLERDDPEMYTLLKSDEELERQSYELAGQVRKSTDDGRADVKKQLEDLLNKHFEVRQQRRQLQIKRMEEELKRLQEAVGKRSESRDVLVRKRIAELLGEQEDLGF